jgi:hypothetical protein
MRVPQSNRTSTQAASRLVFIDKSVFNPASTSGAPQDNVCHDLEKPPLRHVFETGYSLVT